MMAAGVNVLSSKTIFMLCGIMLECDRERKLTIVRGSLRNHNRGGVLTLGCLNLVPLLQTPTAITLGLSWSYRFTWLPSSSSIRRTKEYLFTRVELERGGRHPARKTCRRRRLREGPQLDSPCPDSLGNSVSL